MNKLKLTIIAGAALLFCAGATTVITSFPSPLVVANGGTGLTSGTPVAPAYVASNYYLPIMPAAIWGNGTNAVIGTFYCGAASFSTTVHVDSLTLTILAGLGGGNMQAAIYNVGSWGKPSTPIAFTSSMSTASTGDVTQSITSVSVPAGPIGVCFQADNTTVTIRAFTAGGNTTWGSMAWGSATKSDVTGNNTTYPASGFSTTGSYTSGSWPNFTSGTTWAPLDTAHVPALAFHVASVP